MKLTKKWGFTLIELLVVVLIIGILAAIALPQYQRAVERSQTTQAFTLLKTVMQAAQAYYVEHGNYPTKFDQLDIKLPADFKENTPYYNYHITDTKSNSKWSLQIEGNSTRTYSIQMGRITGPYKGGGFGVWPNIFGYQIYCIENEQGPVKINTFGSYCIGLMKAIPAEYNRGWISTWKLP